MSELLGFLYARPSFVEGVARLFDFGNTLNEYNTSLTAEQADFLALRADWRVVARDLGIAFEQLEQDDVIASGHRGIPKKSHMVDV